jgi:hypothetical protein
LSAFVALTLLACEAASATPRLVAIGDLHGDLGTALQVLQLAGVVDATGRWIGGDTVLVQTGDLTDRGPDTRAVLDLMMRLEKEAPATGGQVVVLLGNHEAMNILGDWRYVHPDDLASFEGSERRATAFSPAGAYGSWLVAHDAVAVVHGVAFAHGGITPEWAKVGLGAINEEVHKGLVHAATSAIGPEGPLWVRTLAQDPESEACPQVEASLRLLGATRMVVGHTTQRTGEIQVRCGGRLSVIDTGISSAYGGNLAAWELTDGNARALYASGARDIEDPQP